MPPPTDETASTTSRSGAADLAETWASDGATGEHGRGREFSDVTRGALIGRYVVLSQLGAGAMGVVLAAYDPELDRKVALKLLRPGASLDEGAARARLQREAQALARLNHANVVGVHDVGVHDGSVFIAMEFVEGTTLAEWLRTAPGGVCRPWREVVAVFDAAGRGLAAAHARGLVHRDFKPDNVMLGQDGRVLVMDFGLARPRSPVPSGDRSAEPDPQRGDLEGLELTRTGAVVGTPAYMAPEQFLGEEATARSDQFAYAVALFEALYGLRPFPGDSAARLALAVTEGRMREPVGPRRSRPPGWLKAIVRRALATDPADRFEDMPSVLSEMAAAESRRRRARFFVAVGAITGLGAGVFGADRWLSARTESQCLALGDELEQLWSPATRAAVDEGLRATGVDYAQDTADRVISYFDAQAESLRSGKVEVCREERIRERWSRPLVARARWCLEDREMELSALANQLAHSDAASARVAVTAASRLTPVAACLDAERLQLMPDPPAARQEIREVREQLSTAVALGAAGDYDSGLEQAKAALAKAERLEWPASIATARARLGALLDLSGAFAEAEGVLAEAYFEAAHTGALDVSADAATALIYVVGYAQARHQEGLRWARHAEVALDSMREPDLSPRRAQLDNNRGLVLYAAGDIDEARTHHARALQIRERMLGKTHPAVAASLNNLAVTHEARGDYERERELYERALQISKAAMGSNHPDVAAFMSNLAVVEKRRGALGEAKRLNERVLDIRTRVLGPGHFEVASTLGNLANVHEEAGEHDRALELYQRSLAIYEKTVGPDHPRVAMCLANLARLHEARGSLDRAEALDQRALEIYEDALGPEHPELGYPLDGLAKIALQRGRPKDALTLAQRAMKLREASGAAPDLLAESRFLIARALWDIDADSGRDRGRARELAKLAHDVFERVPGREQSAREVEDWLEHRAPESGPADPRPSAPDD